jgi:DNA-binding LytR/AlgR family response regulator
MAMTAAAPRLRVLIVDDEPLARRRLRALLAAHHDLELLADAEDVMGALRLARTEGPDVILLDVRIPGGDGFDVARRLLGGADDGGKAAPFIVFVTADAAAAVSAFDVDAVDFLLKPYDAARLARALDRARAAVARRREAAPEAGRRYRRRFVVIEGRRRVVVPLDEVQRIEADDNYVVLVTASGRRLVRHTLRALEGELDPAQWLRVHRSVMLRRDTIRAVVTRPDGEWDVRLSDGSTVRVGPRYRDRLRQETRNG